MDAADSPLVLSPNMGCPEILSVEEVRNGKGVISVIMAARYGPSVSPTRDTFTSAFRLRPSYGTGGDIALHVDDGPKEIVDWNLLADFRDLRATREIMNSELHYEVRFPDGGPSFYVMVHHSKSRYGGPGYAALVLPERPA